MLIYIKGVFYIILEPNLSIPKEYIQASTLEELFENSFLVETFENVDIAIEHEIFNTNVREYKYLQDGEYFTWLSYWDGKKWKFYNYEEPLISNDDFPDHIGYRYFLPWGNDKYVNLENEIFFHKNHIEASGDVTWGGDTINYVDGKFRNSHNRKIMSKVEVISNGTNVLDTWIHDSNETYVLKTEEVDTWNHNVKLNSWEEVYEIELKNEFLDFSKSRDFVKYYPMETHNDVKISEEKTYIYGGKTQDYVKFDFQNDEYIFNIPERHNKDGSIDFETYIFRKNVDKHSLYPTNIEDILTLEYESLHNDFPEMKVIDFNVNLPYGLSDDIEFNFIVENGIVKVEGDYYYDLKEKELSNSSSFYSEKYTDSFWLPLDYFSNHGKINLTLEVIGNTKIIFDFSIPIGNIQPLKGQTYLYKISEKVSNIGYENLKWIGALHEI